MSLQNVIRFERVIGLFKPADRPLIFDELDEWGGQLLHDTLFNSHSSQPLSLECPSL